MKLVAYTTRILKGLRNKGVYNLWLTPFSTSVFAVAYQLTMSKPLLLVGSSTGLDSLLQRGHFVSIKCDEIMNCQFRKIFERNRANLTLQLKMRYKTELVSVMTLFNRGRWDYLGQNLLLCL